MENRKPLPLSAKGGGLSYSLAVIFNLIISLLVSFFIITSKSQGTEVEKYLNYLVSPVAIGAVFLVFVLYFKQPVQRILPIKTSPKYYLIGLLLIFGLLFSLNSLNDYLIKLFELWGYERRGSSIPDLSGGKIVPVIIVIAVIPAFMEEILFRGLILNNAEGEVGSVNSIFIVGLAFSLYHGSVEQTIYQFICGCLFALLAVRSRSIAPCILIHFINNALILVFCACGLVDMSTGNLNLPFGLNLGLTIASAVCLVVAVVWLALDKTQLKPAQRGGVKSFFILASLGIGAMILLWIAGLF